MRQGIMHCCGWLLRQLTLHVWMRHLLDMYVQMLSNSCHTCMHQVHMLLGADVVQGGGVQSSGVRRR